MFVGTHLKKPGRIDENHCWNESRCRLKSMQAGCPVQFSSLVAHDKVWVSPPALRPYFTTILVARWTVSASSPSIVVPAVGEANDLNTQAIRLVAVRYRFTYAVAAGLPHLGGNMPYGAKKNSCCQRFTNSNMPDMVAEACEWLIAAAGPYWRLGFRSPSPFEKTSRQIGNVVVLICRPLR